MVEKKMLYFKYINEDSDYYVKKDLTVLTDEYKVDELPDNCIIGKGKDSPWKYYSFKNKKIKEQGWKIHVSATMQNAQEVLTVVSKILLEHQIAFKHIIDPKSWMNINSKNGQRTSSGKFITIYPPTDEEFFELLNKLYEQTRNYENGPYILSDKSWKNSNIYYRYGGFNSIYNEKGELCIRDEKGNLIPDYRKPYYQVPEFVKEFDEFLTSKNCLREDGESGGKFDEYEFQGVLRFNNGGGIYTGERKADQKKVVIKEARPKVGLDGQYKDAIDRLNLEHEALTKLVDVEGVVDVLDYFKSWKHYFLVEEYLEGSDLQAWIARNYPFHNESDKKIYIDNVKVIMDHLICTIEEMHERGIGMGDLQPANIMVSTDLKVKLIDFESAADKNAVERAAVQTIGFFHLENKNHEERDWYAVKKIMKFCALPIGPLSEIDERVNGYHNEWIEREFGKEFYTYMREVESLCDKYLSKTKEKEYRWINHAKKEVADDIALKIEGLRKGILINLLPGQGLIHGDIRQFEIPGGETNVLTGGSGAVLALSRTGGVNQEVIGWIEDHLMNNLPSTDQQGLFTGKAGIAAALYEAGYREKSLALFNELSTGWNVNDISLRSGLAGIGLAFISLYIEEGEVKYLEQSELVARAIEEFMKKNDELTVDDWAAIPIGLIDGWSGISLFYSALYAVTKSQVYYSWAKELIERDLGNTKTDEKLHILQTMDGRSRLLPYLSGGSIGIGVAIWYLNHVSGQDLYREERKLIQNVNKFRVTFSGGLFDGAGGFSLLPYIFDESRDELEKNIDLAVNILDLFLIHKENHLVFPGNFGYRLSDDLYSGSAGIILGLKGILEKNPLYWMPIINITGFAAKTKQIKEDAVPI